MEADEMNRASTSEENPGSKKVAKSQLNRKLMDACTDRDVKTAKKVILQGANVNHRTSHDVTPILAAAEHGDVDLIALLCSQPNCTVDLQQKTIYGATPLHLTVFFGHRQAMLELLRRGASTICWDNLGRYPLHFAVTQKDVGAARVLLKYGAPVNVYDTFFESPLYNSVMRKPCVAMAKLLLANGASMDPPPQSHGLGLLLEAVLGVRVSSDLEAVKALIRAGANVNIADPIARRTPLHLAAINGRLELAQYLIQHGADLYAENRAGQTPLEVAFNYRNLKVAHLIEDSRKLQTTSCTSQILETTEGSDSSINRLD